MRRMMTTRDVCAALGRDEIAATVGVSTKTVNEAVRLGAFPAAWWIAMQEIAVRKGVEPPPAAMFSFKRADGGAAA